MNMEELYGEEYFARRKRAFEGGAVKIFALEVLEWARGSLGFKFEGGRALDIGCAHGYVVEVLAQLGYESYGVDISPIITKGGEGFLLRASWLNLPFPPESFSLVTSFEVIEHLPNLEAAYQAVKEAFRILKPGGIFVFTTPLNHPLNKLSDKIHREHHNLLWNIEAWRVFLQHFTQTFHLNSFLFLPLARFPVKGRFHWVRLPPPLARHLMGAAIKETKLK